MATINATALKNDGEWGYINITYSDFTIEPAISGSAKIVNGTFITLDEVPPTITFNKANGSTVGPMLNVNATIYDLSGVNTSTIEVYINETKLTNITDYSVSKINDTTWRISIKTNVSKLLGVTLPRDVKITVSAFDTKGNMGTATLIVTAANIGFFEAYPANNSYINTNSTIVSVKYSQINPGTIKMFFDGNNVTNSIIIYTSNNSVTYNVQNLTEGLHTVKVNGTGIDNNEYSLSWSFTVDTIAPKITFFRVKDSDGDGFIERNEVLTAYWNVNDTNFDHVEILYNDKPISVSDAGNLTKANASVTFSLTDYGGYITLKAYDKAGNCNNSASIGLKFYVYNNYVAYVVRSQPKTVIGLNITKLAILDMLDVNKVSYKLIGANAFSLPISEVERSIIPGKKASYTVYTDNNANKTLSEFPDTFWIYDANKMLDFYIKAPAKGLIMVIKLNNSKAKEIGLDLLKNLSLKSLNLSELPELMEYAYIFDENGWVQAKYDTSTKQFIKIGTTRGSFTLQTNIADIITHHSVDLSNGFRLSDHDTNYTTPNYSVRPVLEKGYYALVVISLDNDVTALDLSVPFAVLNGTATNNKPSVTSNVIAGNKIKIEFPTTFNAASAVAIKDVKYSSKVDVDLTQSLLNIANVTLSYDNKPLREMKLLGISTHIWVPEGMFKGTLTTKNVNYLELDTSGLETGNYKIYVVAIDKDYIPLYVGTLSVTILKDTIPPQIAIDIKSANLTTIVIHYKFSDNNLLKDIYMKATYDSTTKELINLTNVNKESVEGDYSLNVSSLSEGQPITIFAKATDLDGNIATLTTYATKPVIANANQTKEIKPVKDVTVELFAGANNTTVTLATVTTNKYTEINVTKGVTSVAKVVPVKYVKVEAKVTNGRVKLWTLKLKYTDAELKALGIDENKLALFYWNGTTWINLKALWDNRGTATKVKVDATHNMTYYKHDTVNNYIEVKMDNLSVFALAGAKAVAVAAPVAAPVYVPPAGGGGYYIPPATTVPTTVTTAVPTTVVTTIPTTVTTTTTTTVTTAATTATTTKTKPTPGFEAIFAIAGLLVVAYLLRRREH